MPRPSWENLGEFFDNDEFSVSVVLNPGTEAERTITGIFDDPYLNAELGEYDFSTSQPRVLGKETDFSGIKRGDTVAIGDRIFDVMDVPRFDGTGLATIALSEAL